MNKTFSLLDSLRATHPAPSTSKSYLEILISNAIAGDERASKSLASMLRAALHQDEHDLTVEALINGYNDNQHQVTAILDMATPALANEIWEKIRDQQPRSSYCA